MKFLKIDTPQQVFFQHFMIASQWNDVYKIIELLGNKRLTQPSRQLLVQS